MNQNQLPPSSDPNEPGNPYAGAQGDAQARELGSNPYYSQQYAAPSQDELDSSAPVLRSTDAQRLNRKALLFLGGIVALLVLMAALAFRGTGSSKDPSPAPREERVVVPTAPAAPPLPEAPPIDVAQSAPPLPPLPEDPTVPAEAMVAPVERGPSLVERRMAAEAAAAAAQPARPFGQVPPGADANQAAERTKATSAQFLNNPDALMVRGTYIRCALETRIITDVDGFTSCVVTEPVYSINGRKLLLPKGSKVYGRYGSGANRAERVAVVWDRITTPTGIDVTMASPGVDNLGSAGHPGDYNAHWGSRISSALFISLLSDAFKYAGEKNGPVTTTTYGDGFVVEQPFQSNTARTVERLANQAVQEGANRPATITINQGTIVNIYVSQDVDFSDVLRG